MSGSTPAVEGGVVTLRHITRRLAGDAGVASDVTVLSSKYYPQPLEGINQGNGWVSGDYDLRLQEEGKFTFTFPNAAGGDGLLHRDRLLCVSRRSAYQPGDEWFEVYDSDRPNGKPVYVGTPTNVEVDLQKIVVTGTDAYGVMNKVRESSVGFWHSSPREAWEAYCGAWTAMFADPFSAASVGAAWSTFNQATYTASLPTATASAAKGTVTVTTTASSGALFQPGGIRQSVSLPANSRWSFEAVLASSTYTVDSPGLHIGGSGANDYITLGINATGKIYLVTNYSGTRTRTAGPILNLEALATTVTLRLEADERWIYGFINGALAVVASLSVAGFTVANAGIGSFNTSSTGVGGTGTASVMEFDSAIFRYRAPFLLRGAAKGDYRMPGALNGGGLIGEYFDDHDLGGVLGATHYKAVLAPTRKPYARRLDPKVDFPSATPPVFQPVGPANGEYFSVRWTGSIWLPFSTQSGFQINMNGYDDGVRLWVGDTRFSAPLINDWANGAARNSSGVLYQATYDGKDGWYPIVIEYFQGAGGGGPGQLIIQPLTTSYVDPGGTTIIAGANIVPSTSLSPLGCFNQQVRYDSHGQTLRALADQFGYQFTCSPRSLESGEFPGQLVPKVRQGRDTEVVLSAADGTDVQDQIDATNAISTLLIDAQGIALEGVQLTKEGINYPEVTEHLFVQTDYQSLADISYPELVTQRATSLLALRSAPFEQVGIRPTRKRNFVDSFPLTGTASEFRWAPGDGLKLSLPEVGVRDGSPRQIMGASWTITPNGHINPTVAFRQRPRSNELALRDLTRAVLVPQRNYQGQLVTTTASLVTGDSATQANARLNYPDATATVVRATLIVQARYGTLTTGFPVVINGVTTPLTVNAAGRYDITPYVTKDGTNPRSLVTMGGAATGTGTIEFSAELIVRI